MEGHDPLMTGMFWGGLIVASVPILLTLGIAVYVLRRYLHERDRDHASQPQPEGPRRGG